MAAFSIVQRQIKGRSVWNLLIVAFWLAILVLVIGGYLFNQGWTGVQANGKLWDWINLLSAPVFISALPLVFRGRPGQGQGQGPAGSTPATSVIQGLPDLQGTDEQKQEAALEVYQDQILELLLDKNLSGSQPGSDVREVARARTLTALRRVGKSRKGEVLRFLQESGLIYRGRAIVDLRGADLSGAVLSNINLSRAALGNTNLSGADLSNTDLSEADLSGTNLSTVNLKGANLKGTIYTKEQLSKG